jgi:hypothetical protein
MALELTQRHPPGVFIVHSLYTVCQADATMKSIIEDLFARGWRFIARYEQFDTKNWPKQQPA